MAMGGANSNASGCSTFQSMQSVEAAERLMPFCFLRGCMNQLFLVAINLCRKWHVYNSSSVRLFIQVQMEKGFVLSCYCSGSAFEKPALFCD